MSFINMVSATDYIFHVLADGGNPFVGAAPTGIVGSIPFMVAVVLMLVFYFSKVNKGSCNVYAEGTLQ